MASRMSSFAARRAGANPRGCRRSPPTISTHEHLTDGHGVRRRDVLRRRRSPRAGPNRGTSRPAIPPTVPNTAMITDSQRTIDRSCCRDCPTARSRPSSRVRSYTDSDSVFAMPIRAMMIARNEQHVDDGEERVDLARRPSRRTRRGLARRERSTGRRPAAPPPCRRSIDTPSASSIITTMSNGCAVCGVPRRRRA